MKTRKNLLSMLLGVSLVCILSGCEITGASPDPDEDISAKPGDTISFQVYGSVPLFVWFQPISGLVYSWERWDPNYHMADIITGSYTYTVPEDVLVNKITITCNLNYIAGDHGRLLDSRTWTIRVDLGCTPPTWNGDYIIENEADVNLLKDYTSITGKLIVKNSSLNSLNGLENLTSVGGLDIRNNTDLESLEGLEGLTDIGTISISGNTSMENLAGLSGLITADTLNCSNNSSLTTLGMDALSRVNGVLYIYGNSSLCNALAQDLWNQIVDRDGIGDISNSRVDGNKDCGTP